MPAIISVGINSNDRHQTRIGVKRNFWLLPQKYRQDLEIEVNQTFYSTKPFKTYFWFPLKCTFMAKKELENLEKKLKIHICNIIRNV
jgi:hypothetical protein